jgi:hypothetical protein
MYFSLFFSIRGRSFARVNLGKIQRSLPSRSIYHPPCTRIIFYKRRCVQMRPVSRPCVIKIADCAPYRRRLFARSMLFFFPPFSSLSARREFHACKFLVEGRGKLGRALLFRSKFYFACANVTRYQVFCKYYRASEKYWLRYADAKGLISDEKLPARCLYYIPPLLHVFPAIASRKQRWSETMRKCYGIKPLLCPEVMHSAHLRIVNNNIKRARRSDTLYIADRYRNA